MRSRSTYLGRYWIVTGIILIVVLSTFGLREMILWIPQQTFDATLWQTDCEFEPNRRQGMIRDLVNNVLPGKDRQAIENILGRSVGMIRLIRIGDEIRTEGRYFDEHEWDLIYMIGRERIIIFDHNNVACSPNQEWLVIRFDEHGVFESWYICGSTRWPSIVGNPGKQSYRSKRR